MVGIKNGDSEVSVDKPKITKFLDANDLFELICRAPAMRIEKAIEWSRELWDYLNHGQAFVMLISSKRESLYIKMWI